jgi:hypothetical protein
LTTKGKPLKRFITKCADGRYATVDTLVACRYLETEGWEVLPNEDVCFFRRDNAVIAISEDGQIVADGDAAILYLDGLVETCEAIAAASVRILKVRAKLREYRLAKQAQAAGVAFFGPDGQEAAL